MVKLTNALPGNLTTPPRAVHSGSRAVWTRPVTRGWNGAEAPAGLEGERR
jgi:hypothetical protein